MLGLLFLKNDCIYRHKPIRFHYTTYNVRRRMDIVNAGTSRCNIMLLANDADGSSSSHHFLYAHVLGAYHTNVIYTGPGMWDDKPRRFDFLWVQWFEVVDAASSGWSSSTLDAVHFPPMHLWLCGSERCITWLSYPSSLCKRQATSRWG